MWDVSSRSLFPHFSFRNFLLHTGCGMQLHKYLPSQISFRNGLFHMQDVGWGMQDAGCGIQDAGWGMQDEGCRMRDVGCGMRDAGWQFPYFLILQTQAFCTVDSCGLILSHWFGSRCGMNCDRRFPPQSFSIVLSPLRSFFVDRRIDHWQGQFLWCWEVGEFISRLV